MAYKEFEKKWGINKFLLAEQEGVSVAAIHMRVYNNGTPFKRSRRPSFYEYKWGMTVSEIAQYLNITIPNVITRVKQYGTPFVKFPKARRKPGPYKPALRHAKPWLHPMHPAYDRWMERCKRKIANIEYIVHGGD